MSARDGSSRPLFRLVHDPGACSGAIWHTESKSDSRFSMRGNEHGVVLPSKSIGHAILERARELDVQPPDDIEAWVLSD